MDVIITPMLKRILTFLLIIILSAIPSVKVKAVNCDITVSNKAQLTSAIEDSSKKVICLNPGDYGVITINFNGDSASNKRKLVGTSTGVAWSNPSTANFQKLTVNANNWSFENLSFIPNLDPNNNGNLDENNNKIVDGTEGNQIGFESIDIANGKQNIDIKNNYFTLAVDMVNISDNVKNVTIDSNVFKDSYRMSATAPKISSYPYAHPADANAIRLKPGNENIYITNNEFADIPGDGIQTNANGSFTNIFIENNNFYITKKLYINCESRDPNAVNPTTMQYECSCAENAIDIKMGPAPGGNGAKLTIRGNTMSGYRTSHLHTESDHNQKACSSTGSWGGALGLHVTAQNTSNTIYNVLVENNIIYDTTVPFNVAVMPSQKKITFRNNLIYNWGNLYKYGAGGYVNSPAVSLTTGDQIEVYNNTFAYTKTNNGQSNYSVELTNPVQNVDVQNNVFLNAGNFRAPATASSIYVLNNAFVSSGTYSKNAARDNTLIFNGVSPAGLSGQFCFNPTKLTNPNKQECIYNVVQNATSPLVNSANNTVGSRANIGVDDKVGIDKDIRGVDRNNIDFGAFEYSSNVSTPTPTPSPTIDEPTPTTTPNVPTPTPNQTNKYDVDENGVVDLNDIVEVIKYLFGS